MNTLRAMTRLNRVRNQQIWDEYNIASIAKRVRDEEEEQEKSIQRPSHKIRKQQGQRDAISNQERRNLEGTIKTLGKELGVIIDRNTVNSVKKLDSDIK